MKLKKVVYVGTGFHPIPSPTGAAVETWINNVAKHLTSYKPYIISPFAPSLPLYEVLNGVSYHRIKMGKIYTRLFKKITPWDPHSFDKRTGSIIKKIDPDIVHIHNRIDAVIPVRRLIGAKAKIILHMHNNFTVNDPGTVLIDKLIACSQFMKVCAAKNFKLNPKDCGQLKNGVESKKFYSIWSHDSKRSEMRKKFGLENKKVLLFVGRVSPEKGVEHVIEAFFRVHKEDPQTRLVIVGEIRKEDRKGGRRGEYGGMVQRMAEPLADKIHFTGCIPPDKIADYYLLGDVFISCPAHEAFGSVFLEASASSLPIVSINVGGVPEAVEEGKTGLLVSDPRDHNRLCSAIQTFFSSSELSQKMGGYGRRRVCDMFSWDRVTKETESLYASLM